MMALETAVIVEREDDLSEEFTDTPAIELGSKLSDGWLLILDNEDKNDLADSIGSGPPHSCNIADVPMNRISEQDPSHEELQTGITRIYTLCEEIFRSWFGNLGIDLLRPRYSSVEEKRNIYKWETYESRLDGDPIYPPHLQAIPKKDNTALWEVYNIFCLKETQNIITHSIPSTWTEKGLNWILKILNGYSNPGALGEAVSMKVYEEYNQKHRKSGRDIAREKNLGHSEDWYSDRRFAEQAFTGTNPTTITKVGDELLDEFIGAAKEQGLEKWAETLSKAKAKLSQRKPSAEQLSFYVQDCSYFRRAVDSEAKGGELNNGLETDRSWTCASVTLFQLDGRGRLHPVAIVIDYKGTMRNSVTVFNKRYTPREPTEKVEGIPEEQDDWPWRYAKTCAQVSDWVRHEIGVHLTHAHFIEEAVIVATHRTIDMNHVIFKLLEPHWYRTLSLNAAARTILVPEVIADVAGLTPQQIYAFALHEFNNFDFVKNYVPNSLEERGFPPEDMGQKRYKNYVYGKNALAMWECIQRYVESILKTHYGEDDVAANDVIANEQCIKDWCTEIQTHGNISSFPNIQTFKELRDAITMMIHIAAPFHTAVNYLQNFYQAFVPAKPPALSAEPPQSLAELQTYNEGNLLRSLPIGRQRQWLLAAQLPWLLSSSVEENASLISFARSQQSVHRGRGEDSLRRACKQFEDDLFKLSLEFFENSNKMDPGSIPYLVMDPGAVARSILI